MPPQDQKSAEAQVLAQIAQIEHQITDLEQEKAAAHRLLLRIRRGDSAIRDVTRRNSLKRLVVEDKIIDVLRTSSKPLKAKAIYEEALKVDPRLKNATFRSYMHRMLTRGLLKKSASGTYWEISSGASSNQNHPVSINA